MYLLSVSMAAVDWIMSLVPVWHSSIFGLIVAAGQLLAAAALGVWCRTGRVSVRSPPAQRRDLGSVLLVLVLAWAYLAFMDYLTVWSADLPGEIVWYLPRLRTSWRWLGVWLIVFHLLLPFAVLLSQARQGTSLVAAWHCRLAAAGTGNLRVVAGVAKRAPAWLRAGVERSAGVARHWRIVLGAVRPAFGASAKAKRRRRRDSARCRHESDAVATRRLRRIAALLATSLAAIMLLMWLLLQTWLHTTVPPIGAVPPEPRLQSDPTAQLAAQRAREQALLDGYAWVDRNAGIARVPWVARWTFWRELPAARQPDRAATMNGLRCGSVPRAQPLLPVARSWGVSAWTPAGHRAVVVALAAAAGQRRACHRRRI